MSVDVQLPSMRCARASFSEGAKRLRANRHYADHELLFLWALQICRYLLRTYSDVNTLRLYC